MPHLARMLTRHKIAEVVTYLVGCIILWVAFPQLLLSVMIAASGLCDLTIGRFVDASHPLYGRLLVAATLIGFLVLLWLIGYVIRAAVRAIVRA